MYKKKEVKKSMFCKRKSIPMPVTLNDCCLLYQMGYAIMIHDGKVAAIVKEGKKRENIT